MYKLLFLYSKYTLFNRQDIKFLQIDQGKFYTPDL